MKSIKHPFEIFLPILGAAVCLVITILIWREVSLHQDIWPLPALYFIEIPAVCLIAAGLFLGGGRLGKAAVWISAGILSVFSLMGAFSVGVFYFPVALLFFVAALAADLRVRKGFLAHLGIFLTAGIVQGALMLAAIQWLVQ